MIRMPFKHLVVAAFISLASQLEVEDVTDQISPSAHLHDFKPEYGFERDLEHPDEYVKQLYVYDIVTPECNFFSGKGYDSPPWPKDCRVLKYG